jgi:hypothetical protein
LSGGLSVKNYCARLKGSNYNGAMLGGWMTTHSRIIQIRHIFYFLLIDGAVGFPEFLQAV